MARCWPGEVGGGKGRCVGSLWVTFGSIMVTIRPLLVTIVHFRVTIGYFFSISKHKAITTELHLKVRQTCLMYTFGRCIVANCLRKSCCTLLSSMSGHLSWHNSPASGSAGEPGRHARDRWGSFISTTDLANIYSYLYLLCSGQRVRLSKGDILQTTALYQCPGCGRTYQVNISS